MVFKNRVRGQWTVQKGKWTVQGWMDGLLNLSERSFEVKWTVFCQKVDGQSENRPHRLDGPSKTGRIFENRLIPHPFDRPCILGPSIYVPFLTLLDFGTTRFHPFGTFEHFLGRPSFIFTPCTFVFGPCTFTKLGLQRPPFFISTLKT